MSDVNSPFTLHTAYENFVPGHDQQEIPLEMLSPHLDVEGCLMTCLLILISFVMGSLFIVPALASNPADEEYARDGQLVTATIISCENDRSRRVRYTYSVDDIVYKGRDRISGVCHDYPIGSALDVLYLASVPTESRLPGNHSNPTASFILGSLCIVPGLVLMLFMSRPMIRLSHALNNQERLAIHGTLIEGEITAIKGYLRHNLYYVCVWYTFDSPRKRPLKGASEAQRQDLQDKELPAVGTPIIVLYADNSTYTML